MHRGEHARVGTEEVPEVIVSGVFPTKYGAGSGHFLLDEGMPYARAHDRSARCRDHFGHGPRGDQVVDDDGFAARRFFQGELAPAYQHCYRLWADRLAALVDCSP